MRTLSKTLLPASARHLLPRRAALAAMFVGCLLVAGCGAETWEWNQKLTVEVQTPDGIRSGSAITNVRWQEANSVGNYPGSYRGEATVVELGEGKYLFALIDEDTRYVALRTFKQDLGEDAGITERGFAAMARIRGVREVPRDHFPLLVTFTDINDPTTVRRVDPDNLVDMFGPGVSLKQITLEITDEEVTSGKVEKTLGWWCQLRGARARLNGKTGPISDNELSNNLGTGAFKVGDCT